MALPLYILNRLKDLDMALTIFWDDISACSILLSQNPNNQTWQRCIIRTIFSSIDYWCNHINNISLEDYLTQIGTLSEKDVLFLSEYKLSSSGKETKKAIKYGKYFEISLRVHSQLQGIDYKLEKNENWQSFLVAISVRNRLTHPKSAEDLMLTRKDFKLAFKGCLWALNCIKDMFGKLPGNAP